MRELDAWHGGRHRRVHDAAPTADAHVARAHDSPKHAAHDSPKLKMLLDPVARKAEHLRYRQTVEAYEAKHAAGQLKPQEARPEHASAETTDKPATGIAKRREPAEYQELKQPKRERSWLPRADRVRAISDIGLFGTALAVALGGASATWDAVAVAGASAVVSNVALANRRWREKHGDRSESRADD